MSEAGLLSTDAMVIDQHDLLLFDLDGVVYIGPDVVPGAAAAIDQARERGVRTAYITNNASRPPQTVADHLTRIGVPTSAEEVVTSAQAASALLAERLEPGAKVLVVGGEGLYVALQEAGLQGVASMDDAPAAVVQGFSPDIGWRLLAEGTRGVRSGLPWIATNTDMTVPTAYGPAPGNGTLVCAVQIASGVVPEVAGKPEPPLFTQAKARYGAERPLVVGDRLDTDLQGARSAGMPGLLVLTGVHGTREVVSAPPDQRPDLIGADLSALFQAHPPVSCAWLDQDGAASGRDEGAGAALRATCRAAAVRVGPDGLQVEASGQDPQDGVDLLRAAAVALWRWTDSGRQLPELDDLVDAVDAARGRRRPGR